MTWYWGRRAHVRGFTINRISDAVALLGTLLPIPIRSIREDPCKSVANVSPSLKLRAQFLPYTVAS